LIKMVQAVGITVKLPYIGHLPRRAGPASGRRRAVSISYDMAG